MKKHLLFIAMLLIASAGFAQRGGPRGNHGQNGHGGGNHPAHTNSNGNYGGGGGHYTGGGHQGWGERAMNHGQFKHALASVQNQRYESDRLGAAKRVASNNWLTANQIKDLTFALGFEGSKLEFAKMAYESCVNPQDYIIVSEAFRFGSSADELERHIASLGPAPGGGNVGTNAYYGDVPAGGTVYSSGGGNGMSYSGGITTGGGHAPAPVVNQGTYCGSCSAYHQHAYVCDHVFGSLVASIQRQCFDSDKMVVAQQIVRDRVLSAEQVRAITMLFTFESYKLDFAKFAYRFTFDKHNYFVVNDAFTFGSSVRELDRFIARC